MKKFLISALIVLISLYPAVGHALYILDYSASKNDRFYTGTRSNYIGAAYDFSGVGYSSSGTWATLVSNNCFISAAHYYPAAGSTVTFWATDDKSGPSYTYTVTGGVKIGSTDLWVGWFDSSVDVNSSIARYPVEMLTGYSDYIPQVIYTLGLYQGGGSKQVVGMNVIDNFYTTEVGASTGITAWYDYDNNDSPSVGGNESYLLVGDSGAPSFVDYGSQLALVGIHWAHTDNTPVMGASSVDSFVPSYFDDINAVLAGRGQSLSAVPEPGMNVYGLIIACCLWFRRRRRRQTDYS
ncbi:MAG: hypothetical protein HGB15_08160 [Chlorobaculum sp.]|jgi:hypothetical protein|nr:hypothetical protein [Chlorobaculum sp.]